MANVKARARGVLVRRAVEALRLLARATPVTDGSVTIVAVNFNAEECLDALYTAVRSHSPPAVRLLVIDNASRDGSSAWYRAHPEVRAVRLPFNLGHAVAMDMGFYLARAEIVVAMDIDAFPISGDWYEQIVGPIEAASAVVSGVSMHPLAAVDIDPYAHPCCLAMRRDDFVRRRHTFVANYPDWDTGQRISQLEAGHLHLIDAVSVRGPGAVGMVFGDIIYHNFYGTRFKGNNRDRIDWVDRGQPEEAWAEAVVRYIEPLRG